MREQLTRGAVRAVRVVTMLVARTGPGGRLAQLVCAHAPALLPASRVVDAGGALVIRHPLPEFSGHLVIVPKARVRSLCALVAQGRVDVFLQMIAAARLVAPPADADVLLSINLGGRQEVAQLHGHLVPVARARRLLGGTVWSAPLPLDDRQRLLETLATATHAAGDCDPRVDGSVVLLGLGGPAPQVRASRDDGGPRHQKLFSGPVGAP